MAYLVAALVVVLPYGPVLAKEAPIAVRFVQRRLARWRRRLRHGAKLARVRGHVRAIEPVRSPMEGVECTFAVTIFEGRDRRGITRRVQVFTGKDFFLETEGGRTLVRSRGADVRVHEVTYPDMPLVRQPLPAAVQAALGASPLAGALALYWREVVFVSPAVEVIGELRLEQAPPDLPIAGNRDLPVLPTLSAVDGVLEIL
jgi:hypothetical protein